MSKTNVELVEHCKKALNERWKYTWGTFGCVLTNVILNDLRKRYPTEINRYYDYVVLNNIGKRNVDCSGLIKSYLFEWENNNPVYNSKYDLSADMILERAKEKGNINTMPDVPGLCVHYKGHIGVYIGNDEVIEARGTLHGVVKTKLKDRPWTHWLKCPFIEYVEEDKLKDLKEALIVLNSKKIGNDVVVNTPEYWLKAIEKGEVNAEYIKALIIKFAEYVKEK